MPGLLGKNIPRREVWDKVTGRAVYTDDLPVTGFLSARLLTSPLGHARIVRIDTAPALAMPGVLAVLTGADCPLLFGPLLKDRPALARDRVRYAGEPVALAVALDEPTAELAARRVAVEYEPLPCVLTPSQALAPGAPLLHPRADAYKTLQEDIYPQKGTNIASVYRMRKGDASAVMAGCAVTLTRCFSLPPSDHAAMEVRTARAEIRPEGTVVIHTASQAPYAVRAQLAESFDLPAGQIQVHTPFVGGGFGGKAPVMLEILAYLASRSVGGRPVRLTIPREQDMASAPCRIGMEATLQLGADREGRLLAAVLRYNVDCGAYADTAPYMTKATAMDGAGPYEIPNLSLDAFCVYTNHTYATSFRSFAHESFTFCLERALDELAGLCGLDPLELRLKNVLGPEGSSASRVPYTPSMMGNPKLCLEKLRELSGWDGQGKVLQPNGHTVRAKGMACLWKTANPPLDAISGALVTCNPDGSVNLNTGAVEMGSGSQTHLAQMLADRLGLPIEGVHVVFPVDTRQAPEHWKTVASLTGYMAGHAVLRAADDLLAQLRQNAALALGCPPEDVEIADGRAFRRGEPSRFHPFKDLVGGYLSPDNQSMGEPCIGRGGFQLKGLNHLDTFTGAGRTGPAWTVGAQAVEIEADLRDYSYRILTASTVLDVGAAIDPEMMRAVTAGGMAMGLSLASREAFTYDPDGVLRTPTLRTYKLLHIGQEPEYRVAFVETPQDDAPHGLRAFSEHGIIGMPAALGSALSAAFGLSVNFLPLTPERLWRLAGEEAQ